MSDIRMKVDGKMVVDPLDSDAYYDSHCGPDVLKFIIND